MKIFFDNIIFSIQKSGGISVVWYELITRLLRDKLFEITFIEYKNNLHNIFRKNLQLDSSIIDFNAIKHPMIWRYLNPIIYKINEKFIFHSSYYRTVSNRNAINITTIHDFTYEKFRSGLKKEIHCYQKKKAILNSDFLICVSENTKNDLLFFYPQIKSHNVFVVYNGASEDYGVEKKQTISKFNFTPLTYMIYVGGRDEYKKFDIAVEIAHTLKFNLVIVGGGKLTSKEKAFISSKLNENEYAVYQQITNAELNYLYINAYCFLYPSAYEGFGIPVIEAQKSGCPVVAYNIGAVKEVIGDTPLLFNNFDVNEIVNLISENLSDTSKRTQIINNGIQNSKKYSWENTYSRTIDIYRTIINQENAVDSK